MRSFSFIFLIVCFSMTLLLSYSEGRTPLSVSQAPEDIQIENVEEDDGVQQNSETVNGEDLLKFSWASGNLTFINGDGTRVVISMEGFKNTDSNNTELNAEGNMKPFRSDGNMTIIEKDGTKNVVSVDDAEKLLPFILTNAFSQVVSAKRIQIEGKSRITDKDGKTDVVKFIFEIGLE